MPVSCICNLIRNRTSQHKESFAIDRVIKLLLCSYEPLRTEVRIRLLNINTGSCLVPCVLSGIVIQIIIHQVCEHRRLRLITIIIRIRKIMADDVQFLLLLHRPSCSGIK